MLCAQRAARAQAPETKFQVKTSGRSPGRRSSEKLEPWKSGCWEV